VLAAQRRQSSQILNHPRLIVCKDRGCKPNLAPRGIRQRGDFNEPIACQRGSPARPAAGLEMPKRFFRRGMLTGRDDESPAPTCGKPLQRQIRRLGAPAGEHDLFGIAMQDVGHDIAGIFENPPSGTTGGVSAAGVPISVLIDPRHHFQDLRRWRRGGVVVEVDQAGHAVFGDALIHGRVGERGRANQPADTDRSPFADLGIIPS